MLHRPFTIAFCFLSVVRAAMAAPANLIDNGSLEEVAGSRAGGQVPRGFELAGDAAYGLLGGDVEHAGRGIRFFSAVDRNHDGQRAGSFQTRVKLPAGSARWYRMRIIALAQDGFEVDRDDLFLSVRFFRDAGSNSLDEIKHRIYSLVERDRKDLRDPGTNRNLGLAAWRSFDLEFHTPFAEVDTLVVGAGFSEVRGRGANSEFWIDEIQLSSIAVPAGYEAPKGGRPSRGREELSKLVPLGGRWYYDPQGGDRRPPSRYDGTNADRLFYLAERLETPFADNTSAWLRKGFLDRTGRLVDRDRPIADNLTLSFTSTHLVAHTHGLPNHPTATFPDRWRALDGNPNYIQEKDSTYYIPLEPRENPNHVAMKNQSNLDGALPGGPVGLAVNGVVFFNPFDHSQGEDAVWRLDRCCGHPAPNYQYHYHKYPVCVKSPWSDDGSGHSPLIGFAFDGFAVYGPYESAGRLAKDSSERPLNEFNLHEDELRGPHYHVTPGKFPHIIGGYWGVRDERNTPRRPPGGFPGRGFPSGPGFRPPQ